MRQNGKSTELKARAFDHLIGNADESPGHITTFGYALKGEYHVYEIRLVSIEGLPHGGQVRVT